MAIAIACGQCDWKGTVKDESAGKRGKCPTCGEPITVPKAGEPDDVEAAAAAALMEGADDHPAPPPPSYVPQLPTPYAAERSDPKPAEDPARRKGPQIEFRAKEQEAPSGGFALNGTAVGGLLTMGGAVLWFALGYFLINRIYIYPPFLFVVGLIAFFRGLAGHED
jgi:hypothetical protein